MNYKLQRMGKTSKYGRDASRIAFAILQELSVITTCTHSSVTSHFASMVRIRAAMNSTVWASVRHWAFKTAEVLLNWLSIQYAVRLRKQVSIILELQASVVKLIYLPLSLLALFKYLLSHACINLRNDGFCEVLSARALIMLFQHF